VGVLNSRSGHFTPGIEPLVHIEWAPVPVGRFGEEKMSRPCRRESN
jgi:hypothetical protein